MTSGSKKIFVLGAGFTRAFLPRAPLLTDQLYGDLLTERFATFPHPARILESERNKNLNREINIERLMTRLDGLMPYDFERGANEELNLLLSEVKRCFERRLAEAENGPVHNTELAAFARYCVENEITCITFNYDHVLDKALWEVKRAVGGVPPPYWHPDGGYGFFCKPSEICVRNVDVFMDPASNLLLKLHGSMNWRILRGRAQPYAVDSVVHDEPWGPRNMTHDYDPKSIAIHLESEPFIVPPVLIKSALVEQPILRVVWSLAYTALSRAEEVIFVGYSLPLTDIAASFLFGEGLQNCPVSQIRVVNLAEEEAARETLRDAYRKVFPEISDEQFDYRGALDWSRDLVGEQ